MKGCDQKSCETICSQCTDKEYCEWLEPSQNVINLQKKGNLICIPGNKEILVKLYFLSSILLNVSNDGIDETRCIGTFSNDALEIAMSLAL